MTPRRLSAVPVTVVGLAAPPASAVAGHHPSYHTPGYRGTRKVPGNVSARPGRPITIGSGENPSILVDGAGTARIVYNEPASGAPDQLHYCRLERGAKSCSVSSVLGIEQPDILANSPSANTDVGGPRPPAVGNELLVLGNRSPNNVTIPGCSDPDPGNCSASDSNDYLFTSEDGGASFGAPGLIGTNPTEFGAVTFGSDSPFIGTVSSEPGRGVAFQATHAGQYATDTASFGDALAGGNGSCCLLAVDAATQRPDVRAPAYLLRFPARRGRSWCSAIPRRVANRRSRRIADDQARAGAGPSLRSSPSTASCERDSDSPATEPRGRARQAASMRCPSDEPTVRSSSASAACARHPLPGPNPGQRWAAHRAPPEPSHARTAPAQARMRRSPARDDHRRPADPTNRPGRPRTRLIDDTNQPTNGRTT